MKKIESLKGVTENIGEMVYDREKSSFYSIDSICASKDGVYVNEDTPIGYFVNNCYILGKDDIDFVFTPIKGLFDYLDRMNKVSTEWLYVYNTENNSLCTLHKFMLDTKGQILCIDECGFQDAEFNFGTWYADKGQFLVFNPYRMEVLLQYRTDSLIGSLYGLTENTLLGDIENPTQRVIEMEREKMKNRI